MISFISIMIGISHVLCMLCTRMHWLCTQGCIDMKGLQESVSNKNPILADMCSPMHNLGGANMERARDLSSLFLCMYKKCIAGS